MRWLLFIARVTFICNLLFILCLLIRHYGLSVPAPFNEFVIIGGWILSVILNTLFVVTLLFELTFKRTRSIPAWLLISNVACFAFQIAYRIVLRP